MDTSPTTVDAVHSGSSHTDTRKSHDVVVRPMRRRRLALRLVSLAVLACLALASLHADQIQTEAARSHEHALGAGWSTRGADILPPAGTPFVIAGVSWYGTETPQSIFYGLDMQDYTVILDQVKAYQFNTLRIPYSNQGWETNAIPAPKLVRACPACQGLRWRDILALIINYAGTIGLHVILDNHRSDARTSSALNGLWYTTDSGADHVYTQSEWTDYWLDVHRTGHVHRARPGVVD